MLFPVTERKTKTITMRCTAAEMEALKAAAKASNLSIGEWIRSKLQPNFN